MERIETISEISEETNPIISPVPEKCNSKLDELEELKFNLDDLFISIDEDSTNFKLDENSINKKRLDFLDQKITPLFLSLIKTEDFEFGEKSESVKLVEEQLKINSTATQNWFNKLYVKNFAHDEKILIGLLRIIESLNERLIHPTGETIAIASLSHKNDEIKELGVRIFENWSTASSYEILKAMKSNTPWLQEYIDQVVKDIEIELCLY